MLDLRDYLAFPFQPNLCPGGCIRLFCIILLSCRLGCGSGCAGSAPQPNVCLFFFFLAPLPFFLFPFATHTARPDLLGSAALTSLLLRLANGPPLGRLPLHPLPPIDCPYFTLFLIPFGAGYLRLFEWTRRVGLCPFSRHRVKIGYFSAFRRLLLRFEKCSHSDPRAVDFQDTASPLVPGE